MRGMRLLSPGHLSVSIGLLRFSLPTINILYGWRECWALVDRVCDASDVCDVVPRAVSTVSDRDPVVTSSQASSLKDEACSKLTVASLSGDGVFLDDEGRQRSFPVTVNLVGTADEVGVACFGKRLIRWSHSILQILSGC